MKKPEAQHSMDSTTWGSPPMIVNPAREVLGTIDLDPASSAVFNQIVGAATFFTEEDNGLSCPWKVNFSFSARPTYLCNPPSPAWLWWQKAMEERRHTKAGIFVGYSMELLQTSQGKFYPAPPDEVAAWEEKKPAADPEALARWKSNKPPKGSIDMPIWRAYKPKPIPKGPRPVGAPMPSVLDFPLCFPRQRIPFSCTGREMSEKLARTIEKRSEELWKVSENPEKYSRAMGLLRKLENECADARAMGDVLVPGDQPPHGSVIVGIDVDPQKFYDAFHPLGATTQPNAAPVPPPFWIPDWFVKAERSDPVGALTL